MTDTWQARLSPILTEVINSNAVPGFVIAVARGIRPPEFLPQGTDAYGRQVAVDTLLPVASITKLATTLAILRLAAAGKLDLNDTLATQLPDARAAHFPVTLRELLSHSAGMPGDLAAKLAPYGPGLDWPALAQACLHTAPTRPVGARVHYSNVGIGLLAIVVERRSGRAFPDALAELVLDPLGIEGYLGTEPQRPVAHIAGEFGEHAGTAFEPVNSAFWRSLALPWGGLVTTAAGALRLIQAFTGAPTGFLPSALLQEATSSQTANLGGGYFPPLMWQRCDWGLGVEVRGDKAPHWTPPTAAPASFGHPGSSGCLAWADPDANIAWVMCGLRGFLSWWQTWATIGAAILGHE
jgi:CubicO group peptidase (beta-lactamase class C family)